MNTFSKRVNEKAWIMEKTSNTASIRVKGSLIGDKIISDQTEGGQPGEKFWRKEKIDKTKNCEGSQLLGTNPAVDLGERGGKEAVQGSGSTKKLTGKRGKQKIASSPRKGEWGRDMETLALKSSSKWLSVKKAGARVST